MVKVIVYVKRSKGKRDEKIELKTDYDFKIGDVITFPCRMARTNSYHGIRVTEIKNEIHEKRWFERILGLSQELVVLVQAEEL